MESVELSTEENEDEGRPIQFVYVDKEKGGSKLISKKTMIFSSLIMVLSSYETKFELRFMFWIKWYVIEAKMTRENKI